MLNKAQDVAGRSEMPKGRWVGAGVTGAEDLGQGWISEGGRPSCHLGNAVPGGGTRVSRGDLRGHGWTEPPLPDTAGTAGDTSGGQALRCARATSR